MYTVNEEGLLNNYATEPKIYYAVYPSPEQQRNYAIQGAFSEAAPAAIATIFVVATVLVGLAVS